MSQEPRRPREAIDDAIARVFAGHLRKRPSRGGLFGERLRHTIAPPEPGVEDQGQGPPRPEADRSES